MNTQNTMRVLGFALLATTVITLSTLSAIGLVLMSQDWYAVYDGEGEYHCILMSGGTDK